jgi:serine/threonine protein kinase/tetratricopeptide (TPR) repeat protein
MPRGAKKNDDLVMRLVEETLARPESERERHLRTLCTEDGSLFDEVWSRVRAEERMEGFLREPFGENPVESRFEPGHILASRFELIREVGEGGMGVVFEAYDRKLDKRIAVKCAKAGFQRRLPPEIRIATEISHPNVCKTHEIHTESTASGRVDFLTMEYLEGETLSARIRRAGPLRVDEGRDVALQLCSGLEEAHRKGVIHGDLKTANVILTPAADGGVRAVVTDFGLARFVIDSTGTTGRGNSRGGTLAFMAPERLKGEKSSAASDIYALGVILYEALSGRSPFADEADPRQRHLTRPRPLTKFAGRAARRLDWIISRCMDPDPARRPSSAGEVAALLLQGSGWRVARTALFVTLAALMAIAVPPMDPVRLALLAPEVPPELLQLGNGLLLAAGELLSEVRASGWSFSIIPVTVSIKQHVHTPEQARLLLGATHVLSFGLQRSPGAINVRAIVSDTLLMQTTRQLSQQYLPADTRRIPRALAGIVTGSFPGLSAIRSQEKVNAAAYPDYVEGLAHLEWESETDDAIASLQTAATADPASAVVLAAMAEAYRMKHQLTSEPQYRRLAEDAARQAYGMDPDAGPVHMIVGVLQRDEGQYARAAEEYLRAIELNPKSSLAWMRLARAYEEMNLPRDALEAYQEAIDAQPAYFEPYRAMGAFYYNRAQYEKAVEYFNKYVELAAGAPEAHFVLATGYAKLEKYAEAEKELRTSLAHGETYAALVNLGAVLVWQGRDADAVQWHARATQVAPLEHLAWMNLGESLSRTGRPAEAEQAFQKALELARTKVRLNPQDAYMRACAGYLLARLGRTEDAEYETDQVLKLTPATTDTRQVAARTYEALGLRDRALEVLEGAPAALLEEIGRHPDMADFSRDTRFRNLLNRTTSR